jgi:outer membrane receptor protein involved in Fe transport
MTDAQVGTVEDITAGQINVFVGTNPDALPEPETADTTTFGVVWTPSFGGMITNPAITLDYYDIRIEDYINAPPAQGVLDGCYVQGLADQCARIKRVGGTLTIDGSGITTLFENLEYVQAEGIEVGANFGVELQTMGSLDVSFNANYYLTQEFHSFANLPVKDCVGIFSASCGTNFGTPLSEIRWIQRTTWNLPIEGQDIKLSYLWRHLGEVHSDLDPNPGEDQTIDPRFYTIGATDYIDLTGAWQATDSIRLTAGVTNLFDEDPPVVGGEAGNTASNSLNTFPSTYDALGRIFSIGVNLRY